ncbi:MAG: MTAP family purine nucleoside phosphorylase [Candidatus Hodarchaeota archaeon]
MLGIIGGTALIYSKIMENLTKQNVKTPYGEAEHFLNKEQRFIFINRHGKDRNIPPHMINHRANVFSLFEAGVKAILSLTSTGSLNLNLRPESFVVPSDYMQLTPPPTFYNVEIKHIVPSIDKSIRQKLIEALEHVKAPYSAEAVYLETKGPRLETRAEIKMYKQFADVVGMNFSSEAALANELELPIANLSTIDNWAHGMSEDTLSFENLLEVVKRNTQNVEKILLYFIENYFK